MTPSDHGWHLDKRVPLTLIILIIAQTVGLIYWAVQLANGVENNQDDIQSIQRWVAKRPAELPTRATAERMIRLEINQVSILRALDAIKRKLNAK